MADDLPNDGVTDENLPQGVEQNLEEAGAGKKKKEDTPVYRVMADAKIPVSSALGKVWKGRRDAGKEAGKDHRAAAEEAVKYFHNDQMTHRDGRTPRIGGNDPLSRRVNSLVTETENVVFSNVTTLVPALYSKNPQIETTAEDKDDEDQARFATMVKHLINMLFNRKAAPGINLKPKAKRGVVLALLTNNAWMEVGYTQKQDSSDVALEQLQQLAEKLGQRDLPANEIEMLEGQLRALEETVDFLQPSGPWARIVGMNDLIVDPMSDEPDHADAQWMMRAWMMPTNLLVAKFAECDDSGNSMQYKSVYEPTHILKGATATEQDYLNNFKMFDTDEDAKKYGYDSKDALDKAKYTKVWFVWDKTTRRVYLFNDKDWSWPIWVWNDPYKLDTFFPFKKLAFHTSPTLATTKGEVTYYLDQQDAINAINDEEHRARQWVKRNLMFDKNKINRDDVEAYLKGDDGTARGVDVPEGKSLKDCIFTMQPPSLNFPQLFDKSKKFEAIDRITGLNEVLRGAQFKTNTTNQAIDNYNASTNMRIDEKIDSIEDWVGDIGWAVAQLCLQFMDQETVTKLIGPEHASLWRNMSPTELAQQYSMTCVGGSTQKPTSQAKKKEAVELGQVLGQFANSAPQMVLKIMLKVFEQAFDEITLDDQDWEQIEEEAMAQMQRGNSAGGAPPQPGSGTPSRPSGGKPPQGGQSQGGGGGNVLEMIDSLSPQAKKAFGLAMARGVPAVEVLQHMHAASGGAAVRGAKQQ